MATPTNSIPTLRAALSYIENIDGGVPEGTQVRINEGSAVVPNVDISFFIYDQPGDEVTLLIEAVGGQPRAYESDSLTAHGEYDGVEIDINLHFMVKEDDVPVATPKPYERYLV